MGNILYSAVDYMNQLSSMIPDTINIFILIIAPVSIFIIFAYIGWWFKITELWTSTTLTISLSLIGGLLLETGLIVPRISGNFLLVFLQWTTFLIQPMCISSSVLVLLYTVKFRRSIQYTITKEGVVIKGGVFRQEEKTIHHNHIGKVIFEQDFIGSRYNYGTVILQDNAPELKIEILNFFNVRSLRNPLNCLFCVPDPKTPQQIINFVNEIQDDI